METLITLLNDIKEYLGSKHYCEENTTVFKLRIKDKVRQLQSIQRYSLTATQFDGYKEWDIMPDNSGEWIKYKLHPMP